LQISTKFTIAVHILAATKFFGEDQKITSTFLAGSIGSNPVIVRKEFEKELASHNLQEVYDKIEAAQITA
jgi:DNA-binding IscR family transcriptional regulator